MSMAPEPEHLPDRPHWRCRSCDRPWPCPDARASLLHEYRSYPSLLKIYLSAQMYEALDDFTANGDAPPLGLYDRFLTWSRNHPAAAGQPSGHHDPDHQASEHHTPDPHAPDRPVPDLRAPNPHAPDRPAPDLRALDHRALDHRDPGPHAPDHQDPDRRSTSDGYVPDRRAADRPARDRYTPDRYRKADH
jgi:hypothetical protein